MKYLNEFNTNNPNIKKEASSILSNFKNAAVVVAVIAGIATAILPSQTTESSASLASSSEVSEQRVYTPNVNHTVSDILPKDKLEKSSVNPLDNAFNSFSDSLKGHVFSSEYAMLSVNTIEVMKKNGASYAILNVKPYIYLDIENATNKKEGTSNASLFSYLSKYSPKIKEIFDESLKNSKERYSENVALTIDSIKKNGINQRVKIESDGTISSKSLENGIEKALNRMGNQVNLSSKNGVSILSNHSDLTGYKFVASASYLNSTDKLNDMLANGVNTDINYNNKNILAMR